MINKVKYEDSGFGKVLEIFQNLFPKNNLKLTLLNTTYLLYVLALLARLIRQLFSAFDYESFSVSEFFINYQGGFVRRGLMGEILFFFAKNFNFDVVWAIKIICLFAFVFVCFFFVKQFLRRGYSLYILPLCFFLGAHMLVHPMWIRKDYLFFCFLIPCIWLYNKNYFSVLFKILFINILSIFIILSHEVYAFFAFPILYVLLFSQFKTKGTFKSLGLSFLCLLPSIFAFVLTILYHGDAQTAQTIWNSWTAILNTEMSRTGDAVEALGWSSVDAFIFHFKLNFLYTDQNIISSLVWLITFPVVYYIATNALFVFRKNDTIFSDQHKTVLSSLLIFQLLCLLPILIGLSCDYIRVIFYWIASSFVVFLIVPLNKVKEIFPTFFVNSVERINQFLSQILYPTKTALVFLMMGIGISGYYCVIEWAYKSTMIYNVLCVLSIPLILIKDFVLSMLNIS